MKVSNTNVRHIRFSDSDDYVFEVITDIINEVRRTMRDCNCDVMYNTQTCECITLDEFDRVAGIFDGLADMDEIFKE